MRDILFLAHRIPWPADRGDKIRSHHILKRLTEMAPVHVGTFADDERDMGFVGEMDRVLASRHVELRKKTQWQAGFEALWNGQPVSVAGFASKTLQDWVDDLLESGRISHIFVFSGQMAQYIPDGFAGQVVMDFVDVDSAKFESYAGDGSTLMRWVNAREGRKLAAFEQQVARRADASLFVSEAEAFLFRTRSGLGKDKIFSLGNGIDTVAYNPTAPIEPVQDAPGNPLIVFTGQMDYRPNVNAVCDFAQNAMPLIRAQFPKAIFAIVGRNPAGTVMALNGKGGVIVTGAVEDARSWLAAADIVVAPLRIARGIQNKVLEAMAMAKAVVVSTAAAEGIDAQDGAHFHIEPNVDAEAARVCALLANPAARERLGQAARKHVVKHYSWAGQLAPLDGHMGYVPSAIEAAE